VKITEKEKIVYDKSSHQRIKRPGVTQRIDHDNTMDNQTNVSQARTDSNITNPKRHSMTLAEVVDKLISDYNGRKRRLPRLVLSDPVKAALSKLFTIPASDFVEVFNKLAVHRKWSQPTKAARLQKLLSLPPIIFSPLAANQYQLVLKDALRKTEMIQVPAWSPFNEAHILGEKQAADLWQRAMNEPEIAPLPIAFLLTQRVGDVYLWRTESVQEVIRESAEKTTVAILVVEGKTVAKTGAFALQVWRQSPLADYLLQLQTTRRAMRKPYLFLECNELLEDHALARQEVLLAQKALKKRVPGLHLWAPRRGSAVALGRRTVPEDAIQTLSRHPAAHTLRRYMAAGVLSNSEGFTQADTNQILQGIVGPRVGKQ